MSKTRRGSSRMPSGSIFYERIVPMVLIGLAILTAAMIVIAAGVLLGVVPFQ